MTRQFKAAAAGVPDPGAVGAATARPSSTEQADEGDGDAETRRSLDRAIREAQAERMLAELKRRMGQ
jgi:hypothetical protein